MDWLLANPQINSTFSSLGEMQGNTYTIGDNCLSLLEEINYKLLLEDHTLRTYRRAISFGQHVKNDLIPILVNVKVPQIIDATIRILVNLTIPVECLLNIEMMQKTETGRHTIFELNKLLSGCKQSFTDSRTTKAIIDFIKTIIEKDLKISKENCDSVNNCLLLLRNILHIPELANQSLYHNSGTISIQNQLVWNLFAQSIDKLLLYLMSCSQKSYWGVTMVQLIALMYKDQHVNTLQKLLNIWFEASLSESSDDNESNTSPPKQCSGDSSPMLTSDPTSDSSDNGGFGKPRSNNERMLMSSSIDSDTMEFSDQLNPEFQTPVQRPKPTICKNQSAKDREQKCHAEALKKQQHNLSQSNGKDKRKGPSSQSEMSDCGYGTQVENQESISTSSNDDDSPQQKPVHHPPCTQKQRYNSFRNTNPTQDKKELRRKKLVKRSRSNLINMKGLLHHTPTDDDISNILKEFTVDFLLKGYDALVQELHAQLLCNTQVQIDTSHFFWLVTYFLKFAAQLELDLEHITSVLSFDIVSYLTYEGVSLCEQLELATNYQGSDLKPCLRRMHLVVTAIREFLQALETYKRVTHLSPEDKEYLRVLQCQIAATNDLKCLFVLLLRTYNPAIQSKQFLQDLVVTNHILLLLLDGVSGYPVSDAQEPSNNMSEHIKQFATVEIMYQYGLLLEDFRENGEYVNDCIFTMMHHIGGDLGQSATLFQPIILKTYSQIWETEYELCDDWSDLIEYVIHKFINTPQQKNLCLMANTDFDVDHSMSEGTVNGDANMLSNWTQEECDNLYWYYVKSKNSKDVVTEICNKMSENGDPKRSRLAVIQQLLQQDIIQLLEYDELMRKESMNFERSVRIPTPKSADNESGIEVKESIDSPLPPKSVDDIQLLRDRLCEKNKGQILIWLQKILIECCFVKLNTSSSTDRPKTQTQSRTATKIMEPVAYHCIIKKQSVCVIPWNAEQSSIMVYQPFVLLLHKLGFHLPADAGKLFVRIPEFWTADILYNIALKLGPVDKTKLKFDERVLQNINEQDEGRANEQLESVSHEYFAVPRSKNYSSMIRYTPEPTLDTPNWLHIVMRSKSITEKSILFGGRLYTSSVQHLVSTSTETTLLKTTTKSTSYDIIMDASGQNVPLHSTTNSNTLFIKTIDETKLKGTTASTLQSLEEHDMASNCETASVASDLTRMYVSDEDEKVSI